MHPMIEWRLNRIVLHRLRLLELTQQEITQLEQEILHLQLMLEEDVNEYERYR
jgi:hypothetical protein